MVASENSIKSILPQLKLDTALMQIAEKVLHNKRISFEEGVLLYEKGELGFVGMLANFIRNQKHGNNTYFNRNFHVEPTNICVYSCKFCSYSRLLKHREEGWELSVQDILNEIKKYDNQAVTEVHITGGVIPKQDFNFYIDLFKTIKAHRPELHIKALTPVEYHYIFKKAKISYKEGIQAMQAAGLGSMPGGGAEIFDSAIRDEIAGGKCSAEEWLEIHETAHQLGIPSNATMLYGHIENYTHRIDHMERLRQLQDRTHGFNAFIPLKFRNQHNEMKHLKEATITEDLRNYAIARIYLDNFEHIKSYWAMIGRNTTQLSLNFGVDDVDGTIDDTTKIYSMAGSEEQKPAMNTRELVHLIKAVGRKPIERDTLYNVIQDYTDVVFEEDEKEKARKYN
ncbi:MAG TPA: aminofutalosine synthase MqnE [Chitinophagales bacterium]|nr:aminofutalosine synthase MqnE [Chitinophagales bacterium]